MPQGKTPPRERQVPQPKPRRRPEPTVGKREIPLRGDRGTDKTPAQVRDPLPPPTEKKKG